MSPSYKSCYLLLALSLLSNLFYVVTCSLLIELWFVILFVFLRHVVLQGKMIEFSEQVRGLGLRLPRLPVMGNVPSAPIQVSSGSHTPSMDSQNGDAVRGEVGSHSSRSANSVPLYMPPLTSLPALEGWSSISCWETNPSSAGVEAAHLIRQVILFFATIVFTICLFSLLMHSFRLVYVRTRLPMLLTDTLNGL